MLSCCFIAAAVSALPPPARVSILPGGVLSGAISFSTMCPLVNARSRAHRMPLVPARWQRRSAMASFFCCFGAVDIIVPGEHDVGFVLFFCCLNGRKMILPYRTIKKGNRLSKND